MSGFLGYKHAFLDYVHFFLSTSTPKSFPTGLLNPFSAQSIFVLRIAPTQMQVLVLGLVEFHDVCMGPPLKPVKGP